MDEMTDIGIDKLGHVIAYLLLTVLVGLSLPRVSRVTVGIVTIGFGILMEILQESLTAYRMLDIYDILANIIGSVIGIWLIWLFERRLG